MDEVCEETTNYQEELDLLQEVMEGDEGAALEESGNAIPEDTADNEGGEEVLPEECVDEQTDKQEDDSGQLEVFDIDELLTRKIKLKDEAEGFIFSRGPKYSDDKWPVNCHVCRLGNLVTTEQIKSHLKSRRHTIKLKRKWASSEQYQIPFFQCADKSLGLDKPIKIYPGEIIDELSEEHDDRLVKHEEFEVKKPSGENILKELSVEPMHEYNKKLPLIGLCYMYKMKGKNGISYYCTLCNMKIPEHPEGLKKGTAQTIGFKHVTAEYHQLKYVVRHFPKIYEKVVQRLQKEPTVEYKQCVRNIFRKLYRKIENAKGFRQITFVDDDDFYKNKRRYLLKTRFDDHYDENTITITEHEVDVLIRKCINRMEFIKPDQNLIGKPGNPQIEERGKLRKEERGRLQREERERLQREERARAQRDERQRPKRRFPQDNYNQDMEDNEEAAWERYHFVLQRELDDLNKDYQNFDRNPNTHPSYFSQERIFYKGAGNDQRKIRDLRRDWMPFWRRRLLQFYDNDLAERKLRIKRELRLRTDIRTPSPMGSPKQGVPARRTPSPSGHDKRYADRPNARDNNMSALPPSEPLGVISVLRLLTALEDQLGSLGPKAVQLMSKAVLAEKSNQNPNDLMMDGDIYIFFVTAKEKLKGQLYAEIVDQNKIGAVTRVVSDITTLLDMFEDYMRRTGKRPNIASTPTTAPKIQFESTSTTDSPSVNQNISATQSDTFRSNANQYTSDNNGSTNQYSSNEGNPKFSGLGLNQYQTGSGSGDLYSSGGNGRNDYSTPLISSSQFQSGSANQNQSSFSKGGIWKTSGQSTSYGAGLGNSQGYSGGNASNQSMPGGMASRSQTGALSTSFGTGFGNSQGTGYSGLSASSLSMSSGMNSRSQTSDLNTLFGTGFGISEETRFSGRSGMNQPMSSNMNSRMY